MPVVRFVAYASTMLTSAESIVDGMLFRKQPAHRATVKEPELSCSQAGELVRARMVGKMHDARPFDVDERSEGEVLGLLRDVSSREEG